MISGKSRKLPHNSVLSGLSAFWDRINRPTGALSPEAEAILRQVQWETNSLEQAVQVLIEAKFLIWRQIPFIVLCFGDYPTPQSLLQQNERNLNEVSGHMSQETCPQQLAIFGGQLLGLITSRILVLEGIRQKFFPYLKSDFYPDYYPAMLDVLRTCVGAPPLHPSDYVTLFIESIVMFNGSPFDKLEAMTERVVSAETRLKQKTEELRLDWKALTSARWDSHFGIRRGWSRFPFLSDVICDLWCLLASYYDAGLSNQPLVPQKLCEDISAIIRESVPSFGVGIKGRTVKDILTYRYEQSVEADETTVNPGVYTCFTCGELFFLNVGEIVPGCRERHPSGKAARFWRRRETGTSRMKQSTGRGVREDLPLKRVGRIQHDSLSY